MRCILEVKSTMSNIIVVVGRSGQIPPSVSCRINAICYLRWLRNLPTTILVKATCMRLSKLHECGFDTWVSKISTLVQKYGVAIDMHSSANFNRYCKSHYNHFRFFWKDECKMSIKPYSQKLESVLIRSWHETVSVFNIWLSISKGFYQIKSQLEHLRNWTWPLYFSTNLCLWSALPHVQRDIFPSELCTIC